MFNTETVSSLAESSVKEDELKIRQVTEPNGGLGFVPFMPELHIFIQSQFTQHYAGLMVTVLQMNFTVSEPLLTYILKVEQCGPVFMMPH